MSGAGIPDIDALLHTPLIVKDERFSLFLLFLLFSLITRHLRVIFYESEAVVSITYGNQEASFRLQGMSSVGEFLTERC